MELRTLSVEDWQKIRKACVTKKPFAHKSETERPGEKPNVAWMVLNQEIMDEDLQIEMINDLSIHAWGDLKDKAGNQIPCTREMKMKLMRMKDSSFRDFVNEKLKILSDLEKSEKEDAAKN